MKLQKLLYFSVLAIMFCPGLTLNAQADLTPYEGNPIISNGPPGSWDAGMAAIPRTVFHDSLFYLFYCGSPNIMTDPIAIGYATSTDGINFTKYENNPVFEGDGTGFDAFFVAEPVLIIEDGTWVLYYNASSAPNPGPGNAIGRATASSPNGPWTRNENAVLKTGNAGEWDFGLITPNSVVSTDSGYVMYYSASSGLENEYKPGMIGMATSPDGISWTKYNDPATTDTLYADSDPVLPLGSAGSWDSGFAWEGYVQETESGWEMYYSGVPSDFSTEQIGYATSPDGIEWAKYDGNPLLSPTETWAGLWVLAGSVILIDSVYYLYYTGFDDFTSAQIGLATMPLTGMNDQTDVKPGFSISQNYPNPFYGSTIIEFSVPESAFVTLKVYNIQGNEVATLISKEVTAGIYKYTWDANILAGGVYFYQLVAEDFTQTKKLMLLK